MEPGPTQLSSLFLDKHQLKLNLDSVLLAKLKIQFHSPVITP